MNNIIVSHDNEIKLETCEKNIEIKVNLWYNVMVAVCITAKEKKSALVRNTWRKNR